MFPDVVQPHCQTPTPDLEGAKPWLVPPTVTENMALSDGIAVCMDRAGLQSRNRKGGVCASHLHQWHILRER